MKVALLKPCSDTHRIFEKDFTYEEISKSGLNIYNISQTIGPWIGYINALECDFFVITPKTDLSKLFKYDVILSLTNVLCNRLHKSQMLCYFEPDPAEYTVDGRTYDSKCGQPLKPYDLFLNNFEITNFENNISCPYAYDVPFLRTFLEKKIPNKIFIQRETHFISEEGQKKVSNLTLEHEKWGARSYFKYLADISRCEYGIDLSSRHSAGQAIAECCSLDVIYFAKPHRLFSKLLLPDFCHVNSCDEALDKIIFLNKNLSKKEEILSIIQNNCNKIKLDNFKALIQYHYNKFLSHL